MGEQTRRDGRDLDGAAVGVGPGSADERAADVRKRTGSAGNERVERGVPLREFGVGESKRAVEYWGGES